MIPLPAVAAPKKLRKAVGPTTKFCVLPELLMIPAPFTFSSRNGAGAAIVKALAPGAKTIESTSVSAERETPVALEVAKVATSSGLFGTVAGVQLAAVFQSLLPGLRFQVALPAKASSRKEEVRIKKSISLV